MTVKGQGRFYQGKNNVTRAYKLPAYCFNLLFSYGKILPVSTFQGENYLQEDSYFLVESQEKNSGNATSPHIGRGLCLLLIPLNGLIIEVVSAF